MTSIAYVSSGPTSLSRFCDRAKGAAFSHDRARLSIKGRFAFRPCLNAVFFGCSGSGWRRRKSDSAAAAAAYTTSRTIRPVMEWQECSSEIEVDVPCSVAYDCYSDRESIPKWMPFISSVKVLKDKPELSRWALKYEVFGRDVEFSWLARNMQPTPNQKIHWRSLEGLPNRGAVRFFPKGPSACRVQLTVSYEVPEILAPVASALKPFLEGLLVRGLEQFAVVAKQYQKKAPQS